MWWTVHSFKLAKYDSANALSEHIRVRPTDCRSPSSASVAEYSETYLAAAVGMHNAVFFELVVARGHLRRASGQLGAHALGYRIAITSLLKQSITVAKCSQPCHVLM
jgi:hypothetical protein